MRVLVRGRAHIPVPAPRVWEYLTDWPRQGEWIPWTRVGVLHEAGGGVGTRLRAWTGVGRIGFWDLMTVTSWHPSDGGGSCEVLHTGHVVRGDGGFEVTQDGRTACTVVWWERVEVPGGPVASAVWPLLRPVLEPALQRAVDLVLGRLTQRVLAERQPPRLAQRGS